MLTFRDLLIQKLLYSADESDFVLVGRDKIMDTGNGEYAVFTTMDTANFANAYAAIYLPSAMVYGSGENHIIRTTIKERWGDKVIPAYGRADSEAVAFLMDAPLTVKEFIELSDYLFGEEDRGNS